MPRLLPRVHDAVVRAAIILAWGAGAACATSDRAPGPVPTAPTTPSNPANPTNPTNPTTGPTGEFQLTVPTIDLNVITARPTATSVALSLFSGTARTATIALPTIGRTVTQALPANEAVTVEIAGLQPDRSYPYRVTAGSAAVDGVVRTARPPGATWRFVMQADSHLDANSDLKIYEAALLNMRADSADFLLDLGDTFMSDKYPDFRTAAPAYYAQRHWFGLVGASTPLVLVQGNHDGEKGWTPDNAAWAAAQRVKHFPTIPHDGFYTNSPVAPRNYVAWSWGDATFIALDPYVATVGRGGSWAWTLGREQYDWLAATLQRTTTPYIFVFLHHLVGGQGSEARGGAEASVAFEWGGANADGTPGFAAQRPGWAKPIHDLLVQHKVSAVFHGHDHLYVYQQRDGLVYQEVPQPSFARENATSSAAGYGYLSGTLLGSSGHLRVTVSPAKATVEYVRARTGAGNRVIDHRYDILPARRP